MRALFVLAIVAGTSAAAGLFGRRALGLSARGLAPALSRVLETLGMAVTFFGLNLAIAMAAILTLRAAGTFISLYVADDLGLVALSLLQALVFQRWKES